jgi:hypothetical protein
VTEAFEMTLILSSSKSFHQMLLGLAVMESPFMSKMLEMVENSSSHAKFLSSRFFSKSFCILFFLKEGISSID